MGNQEIKCSVRSCAHNEQSKYCSLKDITVGTDGMGTEAKNRSETVCASFSSR